MTIEELRRRIKTYYFYNHESQKVYQYDLNGNFLKEYESFRKAGKENNIKPSLISACCSHKRKSAGKFFWSIEYLGQTISINLLRSDAKIVYKYDKEGNYLQQYSSLMEAAKENKTYLSGIIKSCKNFRYSSGGYRWSYQYIK